MVINQVRINCVPWRKIIVHDKQRQSTIDKINQPYEAHLRLERQSFPQPSIGFHAEGLWFLPFLPPILVPPYTILKRLKRGHSFVKIRRQGGLVMLMAGDDREVPDSIPSRSMF